MTTNIIIVQMTNITVDDINITMIDNIVITINIKTNVSTDDT